MDVWSGVGGGGEGGYRTTTYVYPPPPFAPLHSLRQITKTRLNTREKRMDMSQDDCVRKSCDDIFTDSNKKLVLLFLWKKPQSFTVLLSAKPSECDTHLAAVFLQHSVTSLIFKLNYMYAFVIVVVGASHLIKNYLVFKPKVRGEFSWHVLHPHVSPFLSIFEHEVITCCSAGFTAALK